VQETYAVIFISPEHPSSTSPRLCNHTTITLFPPVEAYRRLPSQQRVATAPSKSLA
ncbi:unnamed protein product, partial [Closterium sp. Naga37s-1]